MTKRRNGFTLIELAMMLAVSGLLLSFVLKASQSTGTTDCYPANGPKMEAIREGIEKFARVNSRLPLPAQRNIGTTSITYGAEAAGAAIDTAAGVSFGAVPFKALGLSPNYGIDCWGNKFTYAVTAALTTSNPDTGFLNAAIKGNIAVKSSLAVTTNPTAAYAIISHGQDGLGAVKANYSGAGHGWCSGVTLKEINCTAGTASVMNATINNGDDAGANYFDDIVLTSGKPTTVSSTYCWGYGAHGEIGNNSTLNRSVPTLVALPQGVTSFTSMAGSYYTDCAIGNNGQAYCWGLNNWGQVGDNTVTDRIAPTQVSLPAGVTGWSKIATPHRYYHNCAITNTGLPYCWGQNTYGGLGNNSATDRFYVPQAVVMPAGVSSFISIGTGVYHTCGLANTGAAYCWGYSGYGEMGNNTGGGYGYLTPTPVTMPACVQFFRDLQVGDYHNCAIGSNYKTYCWGYNNEGEIGNGNTTHQFLPVAVTMPAGVTHFIKLAVGGYHTCAIGNNNLAYCWGFGVHGVLGNGSIGSNVSVPTAVTMPSGVTSFSEIASGSYETCAIGNNSRTYCWGYNLYGGIGDGTEPTDRTVPTLVTMPEGVSNFTGLNGTGYGACATTTPKQPYCWGYNAYYQVGDLTNVIRGTPTPVTMPKSLTGFQSTTSSFYNECAIGNDGQAYCWGYNPYGNLGDGTYTTRTTPTQVVLPGGVTSFTQISTHHYQTCAIGNNGRVYCWGWNLYGQLGDGTNTDRLTPTQPALPGGLSFISVGMSLYSGCALASTGNVYCWGYNWYGQVGNGAPCPAPVVWSPSLVALPGGVSRFNSLSVGGLHACALADTGDIWCWGGNEYSGPIYGQMGDSGYNRATPTLISKPGGVSYFTKIVAGYFHNCALANTGNIYCWGHGAYGVRGNGTWDVGPSLTAVSLPSGVTHFTDLSDKNGGAYASCATGNNGVNYCWGYNGNGELGSNNIAVNSNVPVPITMPEGVSRFSFISPGGYSSCAIP